MVWLVLPPWSGSSPGLPEGQAAGLLARARLGWSWFLPWQLSPQIPGCHRVSSSHLPPPTSRTQLSVLGGVFLFDVFCRGWHGDPPVTLEFVFWRMWSFSGVTDASRQPLLPVLFEALLISL